MAETRTILIALQIRGDDLSNLPDDDEIVAALAGSTVAEELMDVADADLRARSAPEILTALQAAYDQLGTSSTWRVSTLRLDLIREALRNLGINNVTQALKRLAAKKGGA